MSHRRKRDQPTGESADAARRAGTAGAAADPASPALDLVARRHLRFGWWALLGFLALGVLLETLHGFKVGWYLEEPNATRRHLWTLAHAHGTLLSVLNLIVGATARRMPRALLAHRGFASTAFLAANIILPAGFFLGGLVPYGGDPGLGIFLVPLGALLLVLGVIVVARSL